ncbi:hypothetical protein [Paenibacillus daejeonensis]|uniref:hypothetical protein n=1 Tax=Paenibacillus daejeonensis TaxID=135193 RepID=UPI0007C81B55|nr:hypothetical protein [Paenibacillus daejeonensis]
MNISQMMRGLLGELQGGDSRTLELKPGQVVRGVVVSLLEGDEAMVQINGNQVRAKLELPLQPGQATMLQVQPEASGGMVVLRPVDPASAAMPEAALRDLVRGLGLPDKPWAQQLMLDMKREGFPLNRELSATFTQAAAGMPKGANPEQWMQAAALAFKRGLPVTASTVAALQQAMFGRPAHELLEGMQSQLRAFLGNGASEASATGAQQAAGRVLALLQEGTALLRMTAEPGGAASASAGGNAAAGAGTGAPGSNGVPLQASATAPQGAGTGAAATQGQAAQTAPSAVGGQGTGAPGGSSAAAMPPASATPPGASAQASSPGGTSQGAAAPAAAPQAGGAGPAGAAPGPAPTGASGWVGDMLRWLGVDHERQLLMRPAPGAAPGAAGSAGGAPPPATPGADGQAAAARPAEAPPQPLAERAAVLAERAPGLPLGGPVGADSPAAEAGRPAATQESLKGALLQLAAREDAPPALREAAQQLLQQITGQQLLLSAERGGAVMSHLSIFVPLHGQDGSQTASVHIQTRRGRKGEIDASNCRLLFDLQMKRLGDTLVDVHVVDKIVSLTIWNDHPAIAPMLEASRGEVSEALGRSGYQLLTLRSTPLPDPAARDAAQTKKGTLAGSEQLPGGSSFAAKPYRGVDFRA